MYDIRCAGEIRRDVIISLLQKLISVNKSTELLTTKWQKELFMLISYSQDAILYKRIEHTDVGVYMLPSGRAKQLRFVRRQRTEAYWIWIFHSTYIWVHLPDGERTEPNVCRWISAKALTRSFYFLVWDDRLG